MKNTVKNRKLASHNSTAPERTIVRANGYYQSLEKYG